MYQTAFRVHGTVQGKYFDCYLCSLASVVRVRALLFCYIEWLLTRSTSPGVGFRDFTQKRAVEYGLKGWVKNTTCGKVEGEVQGNEETLQKFFKDIDKGPRLAHVVKLEKRDLSPEEGEDHFVVRRTSDSVFEATK
ncbi:Acylphosphatase [Aspergillus fumigatus Z5]|nr:Acylphosphatase [Aspergillus fumigatus Z5]